MYVGLGVGQGSLVELVCVGEMAMGFVWELVVQRFVEQLDCCLGFLDLGFLVQVRLLGWGFMGILRVLACSFIVATLAREFLSRRVRVRLTYRQVAMEVMVEIRYLSLSLLVEALGWLCEVVRFVAVRLSLVFLEVRIDRR